MKSNLFIGIAFAAALSTACDNTTDGIGGSLSDITDGVNVVSATFDVPSQSIAADSVLSRSARGYLGKVRDPETGAYITGDFMAQFYCPENYSLPKKDSLVVTDRNGNKTYGVVQADSCLLRIFYDSSYGDPNQAMKLTAYEMGKPMNENRNYYSNFDPMALGYIREGGLQQDKAYSLTDYNVPKTTRDTTGYLPYITINLSQPYTDRDGKQHNNFGTYVMQKYYDDPSNFKNSFAFTNNVVPGFYFKSKSGLGSMAYVQIPQLDVFFKRNVRVAQVDSVNGRAVTTYRDSAYNSALVFWGTEEVLQSTRVTNDQQTIKNLIADNSCTYLKTPSGIFTELTIPVDQITQGHENDSISSARISIQRVNNTTQSEYAFNAPQNVLMLPKDSIHAFFEHTDLYDNKTSFLATLSNNGYTFPNMSGIVKAMAAVPRESRSANWNKVVLVPVEITQTTLSSNNNLSYDYYYYLYYGGASSETSSVATKVTNDMSLTSTRLVRGTESDSPIKLSVIYSKFK